MRTVFIGVVALVALSPADARAVSIYSSGPIGGTDPTHPVNGPYAITESFTVSGSSTLASATVGLWTQNAVPNTIDWSIGTTPFGSEISSGTGAALTNVFHNIAPGYYYSVYASSFNLTGSLTSGTYYLTLSGGTVTGPGYGNGMFWDANGGTSSGYWGEYGHNLGRTGSASFTLYGNPLNPCRSRPHSF